MAAQYGLWKVGIRLLAALFHLKPIQNLTEVADKSRIYGAFQDGLAVDSRVKGEHYGKWFTVCGKINIGSGWA